MSIKILPCQVKPSYRAASSVKGSGKTVRPHSGPEKFLRVSQNGIYGAIVPQLGSSVYDVKQLLAPLVPMQERLIDAWISFSITSVLAFLGSNYRYHELSGQLRYHRLSLQDKADTACCGLRLAMNLGVYAESPAEARDKYLALLRHAYTVKVALSGVDHYEKLCKAHEEVQENWVYKYKRLAGWFPYDEYMGNVDYGKSRALQDKESIERAWREIQRRVQELEEEFPFLCYLEGPAITALWGALETHTEPGPSFPKLYNSDT